MLYFQLFSLIYNIHIMEDAFSPTEGVHELYIFAFASAKSLLIILIDLPVP